MGSYCE